MREGLDHLPRVAVLLSGREQFSSYYGGAVARWTYEVYSRLSDRISVTVFAFPTDDATAYPLTHKTGWAWRTCNLLKKIPFARRYEETVWLWSLAGCLREFAVIHLHNRPQWPAILRELGYKGAIVLHLHNDHIGHWPAHNLNALASQLDAVAVCSKYLRGTFETKSAALDGKTRVVHNGANLQIFFPREQVREPETIFFVGRFDPEKGILQLLQAYEKLLDTHPHAKLIIGGTTGFGAHGENAYVRDVLDLAADLRARKRAQIELPGYIHHDEDLPRYFQKATVFACPSIFQEPFGLVNAEAMACATPVVGSNRGGIPEVVGDTGRLVDPENINELAAAISGLLSSPQETRKFGEAARKRCQTMFDWNVTAESWMALIRDVL